jgi:hypothetical protein
MDGGGKIKMDGSSGNGQWRCNEWWNGKTNPMGKSKATGGDARWTVAVITMHDGSKIAMDGRSGNRWMARVPRLMPSDPTLSIGHNNQL